jgi:hypothetical protein
VDSVTNLRVLALCVSHHGIVCMNFSPCTFGMVSIFLTSFYMAVMNLGDIVALSCETINHEFSRYKLQAYTEFSRNFVVKKNQLSNWIRATRSGFDFPREGFLSSSSLRTSSRSFPVSNLIVT